MGHHLLLAKDAVGSSATYKLVFHLFIINFPKARPTSWYICCFTLQGGECGPAMLFLDGRCFSRGRLAARKQCGQLVVWLFDFAGQWHEATFSQVTSHSHILK